MIRVHFLKRRRREVKVDPKLDGQWNVLLFGGPWKVPLFGGQWKVKEKHIFTFSPFPIFPPTNFT
jgi:hypothetical protein